MRRIFSFFTMMLATLTASAQSEYNFIAPEDWEAFMFNNNGTVHLKYLGNKRIKNVKVFYVVDLNLSDGTLWSTMNVGAENSWDYGDYFAWGETESKTDYSWKTYKYAKGASDRLTKYCSSVNYSGIIYGFDGFTDGLAILESIDDAATVHWGEGWYTPTAQQWQTLYEECYWQVTNNYAGQNVKGYIVYRSFDKTKDFKTTKGSDYPYSEADPHIFLPAAGAYEDTKLYYNNESGWYWSASTRYERKSISNSCGAFRISLPSTVMPVDRTFGFPIRPVRDLKPRFSVSANKKVYFSKGNLQYNPKKNEWRFAKNQYDLVDATVGQHTTTNYISNYNGLIDLFGWGTSGYNNKKPYMSSASCQVNGDLTGSNAEYDWGVYNCIQNEGEWNGWRTLSASEWQYLFDRKDAADNVLYGVACVCGTNGMVLLPDRWKKPDGLTFTPGLSGVSDIKYYAKQNSYDSDQWAKMEQSGAVFLPAAGYRQGTEVNSVTWSGLYWSSTTGDSNYQAKGVYYHPNHFEIKSENRSFGWSVRLVRDAK